MNEEQIAEIEARANAATEGPWDTAGVLPRGMCEVAEVGAIWVRSAADDDRQNDDSFDADKFHSRAPANAEFIARAREDVPALIAEVRRLTRDLAHLRAAYEVSEHQRVESLMAATRLEQERDAARALLAAEEGDDGSGGCSSLRCLVEPRTQGTGGECRCSARKLRRALRQARAVQGPAT